MLMNIFKLSLVFLLSCMTLSSTQAFDGLGEDCFRLAQEQNDCRFYRECLERKTSCGEKGYALSYGEMNCQLISSVENLSPKGLAWREATRSCLQLQLLPLVSADWKM